ncbi:MAG: M15 family metallopeptidase [Candidatus Pacebacteria bacterium]|nr:M15 family metallopeptidase [Candidatus Paceibacterota bacterium]
MNQGTKRTLIIGFFILIWLGIIFYGYLEMKALNGSNIDFLLETSLVKEKPVDKNKDTFFTEESIDNNSVEEISEREDVVVEDTEKTIEENFIPNQILDGGKDVIPVVNEKAIESFIDEEPEDIEEPQVIKAEREMCGDFPCFSDVDFVNMYDDFEKQNSLSVLNKYIYNNQNIDNHIKNIAENRGYKKRTFADESKLVWLNERRINSKLKSNFIKMRNEMQNKNISLHFVSGYRSSTHQRKLFKNKMKGIDSSKILSGFYDKKINEVLKVSAIPGYSRHHSGYTVDFGCGNDYLVYSFATTPCYEWLSENNFENAKRFGFIPSYPENGGLQGPDPEPWEYVWVGRDYIENYFNNLDKEKNENL